MTVTIENEYLTATIAEQGAELQSLKSKATGLEYIWTGDPAYWGKHAPILFPIVGALKDGTYTYQGKTYSMPKHGLARISRFTVLQHNADQASLIFQSTPETKAQYPFDFEFIVHYQLTGNTLVTRFEVVNLGAETMFYAVGGHPAFNVPLEAAQNFDDYRMVFETEHAGFEIPMVGDYVDLAHKLPIQLDVINLNHELFAQDVRVYEIRGKNQLTLESTTGTHKVTMTYDAMPYVGLWTTYPQAAPFLCIEPWAGIPDDLETSGELSKKVGIESLTSGARASKGFELTIE